MTPDIISSDIDPKPKSRAKTAFQLVFGALVGGIAMLLALRGFDALSERDISPEAYVGLFAGVVFIVIGAMVGLGTLFPRAGQHLLEVESAEELRDERRTLGWGAAMMVAVGLWPAALVLGGAGVIDPTMALVVCIVIFALVTLVGLFVKFDTDELNDAVVRDSGMYTFYAIAGLFGGWASLAHLDVVPPFSMLGFVAGSLALWLAMIMLAAFKRGLA